MFELDLSKFRRNLKNAREVKGYTAKQLSEVAGLRQLKRVSDIEDGRGNPTLDEIHSLCIVLNAPIDEMLHLESQIVLRWNGRLAIKQE